MNNLKINPFTNIAKRLKKNKLSKNYGQITVDALKRATSTEVKTADPVIKAPEKPSEIKDN